MQLKSFDRLEQLYEAMTKRYSNVNYSVWSGARCNEFSCRSAAINLDRLVMKTLAQSENNPAMWRRVHFIASVISTVDSDAKKMRPNFRWYKRFIECITNLFRKISCQPYAPILAEYSNVNLLSMDPDPNNPSRIVQSVALLSDEEMILATDPFVDEFIRLEKEIPILPGSVEIEKRSNNDLFRKKLSSIFATLSCARLRITFAALVELLSNNEKLSKEKDQQALMMNILISEAAQAMLKLRKNSFSLISPIIEKLSTAELKKFFSLQAMRELLFCGIEVKEGRIKGYLDSFDRIIRNLVEIDIDSWDLRISFYDHMIYFLIDEINGNGSGISMTSPALFLEMMVNMYQKQQINNIEDRKLFLQFVLPAQFRLMEVFVKMSKKDSSCNRELKKIKLDLGRFRFLNDEAGPFVQEIENLIKTRFS